ncbi:hypothetical protein [Xanthomarina gelatinilytica]|uniref:hypothetical protein n=1 Tax=Xanthomarina gelatinilytica TaxID=1137281 RepID=UPI003AA8474D
MKHIIYLTITFWFFTLSGSAQKNDRLRLDPEVWEKSKKEVSYDPVKEKEQTAPQTDNNTNWNLSFIQPLLFGLIIAVILIALIIVIRKSRQPAIIKPGRIQANTLAEAEENLPDVTLDKIYQEAIEKGEFKSALRIKFLMILQSMIDAEMIIWKKRKTNEQYLRELTQSELKNSFNHIVILYDKIWYGSVSLSEDQYHLVIQRINSLNGQLHGKE